MICKLKNYYDELIKKWKINYICRFKIIKNVYVL